MAIPPNCDTTLAVTARHGPELVRAIGRWSLAALTVNSIIGSGVFGLPSDVARLTGTASPVAVLISGAAMGVIMACYAEVASYFTDAGGPYLYGREAFGRLVGIESGWMLWLAQLSAPAANAYLFVIYLGQFWHRASDPLPRSLVLTFLVGFLALVNYRGVRTGTEVSNLFTVAKLLPLGLVIVAGAVSLAGGHKAVPMNQPPAGTNAWLEAILLMVFAYGGFESALAPMSEAKNPARDAAFALFAALLCCTLVYTLMQWVVVGVLVNPASSSRPLADVAGLALGNSGATLVTLGVLVSLCGYLSAKMLGVPRITYALAEGGDFPGIFGEVHPLFHTPHISILAFAAITWLLALLGSFSWNVTLSAVARLFYYGMGCAALPVLRRRRPGKAQFRLPGGLLLSFLGVTVCLVLVTRVDTSKSLILLGTVMVAFVNWLRVRDASSHSRS
jgi:APA family basic amino acid/polyamine antiporter